MIYVIVEQNESYDVVLHGAFQDLSAAVNEVCRITEGKAFEEEQDENDETVWVTLVSIISIKRTTFEGN